jgi:Rap1a immunity proteins
VTKWGCGTPAPAAGATHSVHSLATAGSECNGLLAEVTPVRLAGEGPDTITRSGVAEGSQRPMKYMACIFMLGTFLCYPAAAAQMKLGDLYELCTSSNEGDKSACRFYILGVFEAAQMVGGSVQDKSGNFQEAKDKRFCVPEGLTGAAMELTVKMKMGADLAVFPEDRDGPAISSVMAVIAQQFLCQKTK